MRCLSCDRLIEPDSRFCPGCGTPVIAPCAACGAELTADARFCASCGAATGGSRPGDGVSGARERKVATLLFADIVGFTSLSERQDPELVQGIVNRAFDRIGEEVRRYEGLIEKFAGDAMLAIFGVPSIHEDDAERAVRAALEMQHAMAELRDQLAGEGRPGLALRIGIETGEVLVDQARVSAERDRMVTGDPVNVAARLQQASAPGAVIVGPGTYAATRDLIEYEELEPVILKGKELPLAIWRAAAVRTRRGGQRPVLGLEAPLVGRNEELSLLKETVRRTVAEGRPHLVTVLGSAGVGKSRLTWELEKYLDGLPEVFHWRKGRCLAYAQASYSALADAVAADASILDDEPAEAAVAKLRQRLATLADGTSPEDVLAGVRAVLGLGSSGADLGREELFEACRVYLDLVARRAPLVLVLEDIHWADEGLLDLVEFLARWGEGPMLILCLARHELLERRAAWSGGLPNAATIVLEPLDADENAQLIGGLLRGEVSDGLRQRIADVAEGNPLFTEELIRLFVDRGVIRYSSDRWQQARPLDESEVPGSIHALLAARLDSLPAEEKRLGQDAAVVGRIFWDSVVAHLAGAPPATTGSLLRRLRVKELIVPREPSSLSDAAEFGFRHVLIRDVAYESLPKLERARKHREVARWAEDRLGERPDEMVELLAAHYWSALRYEEEFATDERQLTDLRSSALEHARAAGERALELWQMRTAADRLRVAIEQSRRLGRPPLDHAELVLRYSYAGEAVDPLELVMGEMQLALELLGDRVHHDDRALDLASSLRNRLAAGLVSQGDAAAAVRIVEAGLEQIGDQDGPVARARLLYRLGWIRWRTGPIDAARPLLEGALSEAGRAGHDRLERWALHDLGIVLSFSDREDEGIALMEQSMDLARSTGDRALLLRCYVNLASTLIQSAADIHRAAQLSAEGLAHAQRTFDGGYQHWAANNLACAYAEMGRLPEAMEMHAESVRAGQAMGYLRVGLPEQMYTELLMGRLADARRTWDAILATEREPEPQMAVWWDVLRALSEWDEAPHTSVERLAATIRQSIGPASEWSSRAGLSIACRLLPRMGLRIGNASGVALGLAKLREMEAAGASRPLVAAWVRWMSPFEELASAETVGRIQAASDELEQMGMPLHAADALADAGLLARRAGVSAEEIEGRAARLYEACSALPVLGILPEVRWIAPAEHRVTT